MFDPIIKYVRDIKKTLTARIGCDGVIPFLCCVVDETRSRDLAARLIVKYEDDYPLHVETQKDFDVVCNRDTDAFFQGIS